MNPASLLRLGMEAATGNGWDLAKHQRSVLHAGASGQDGPPLRGLHRGRGRAPLEPPDPAHRSLAAPIPLAAATGRSQATVGAAAGPRPPLRSPPALTSRGRLATRTARRCERFG